MRKVTPTREQLTIRYSYDPETGIFTDKKTGKAADTVRDRNGHRHVVIPVINGQWPYLAHQLAWLYMTGEFPDFEIDHENRDGTDNRWSNLRDGTDINRRNLSMKINNKSGVTGVSWCKNRLKWRGVGHYTERNGTHRQKFLGYFEDIESAALEVLEFRHIHGYDPGHGLPRCVQSVVAV